MKGFIFVAGLIIGCWLGSPENAGKFLHALHISTESNDEKSE